MTRNFLPEGRLYGTAQNQTTCATRDGLRAAMECGCILEGMVLCCDADHDLLVALGNGMVGRIPRDEAALGVTEGHTREIAILSRVGKPVCFTVDAVPEDGQPLLSRRKAQRAALDHLLRTLTPGTVISATVSHLEPFGTFVDIGCGCVSMIGIENSSVSRIPHPRERFAVGQEIYAAVLSVQPQQERIFLSHKELLGTWEENVALFQSGMTVPGYVRGIKDYGAFVELTPNLSGLAELQDGLQEGDRVSVHLKAVLPGQMKIKLLIIDRLPPAPLPPLRYFITEGRLSSWRYAPECCKKSGCTTVFF